MKTLPVVIAKLKPEYWERIKAGTKHFELRDEEVEGRAFLYVHPETGRPLGAARILGHKCLPRTYQPVLAELGDISEAEVEALFASGDEYVYAYQIEPFDTLTDAQTGQSYCNVNYFKDDQPSSGKLIIQGNKVGLTDPQGNYLKETGQ